MKLYDSGKEAFPAIIEAIGGAKATLDINMFIWRDDAIGNKIAEAVLAAAERGVRVTISVDRYGVVLEKAEECMRSFFHKSQSAVERLKSRILAAAYPTPGMKYPVRDEESALYRAIMAHPNITVERDTFKADHSKFYVIDEELLFLGGINVEDKENGADMHGRVYGDLMVGLYGRDYVEAFRAAREGRPTDTDYAFPLNRKTHNIFAVREHYLSLIRAAERELIIVMPYLSPLSDFMREIAAAADRGVSVTVMIPARSNFQDDTNKKAVARLFRMTGGRIAVYFTPKMLHTKLIVTEKTVSFGSANITKKAFSQLDELNLARPNTPDPFTSALTEVIRTELDGAKRIESEKEIKYRRLIALFEGLIV